MNFKHYFASMLAVAAAVVACEPAPEPEKPVEPKLDVTPVTLTVGEAADEATFQITTNQDWTAESDAAWAVLDVTKGVAAEEAVTVTVAVEANTEEAERVATITVNAGKLSKTVTLTQAAHVVLENGTQEKPWLIKTAADLVAMREKATPGTQTYFKMEADVDMTGVTGFVPVNYGDTEGEGETAVTTYTRQIYFDGNNKTISNFTSDYATYPSLFGVLYGTVKDLTVTNATITSASSSAGILAGYAGTEVNSVAYEAFVTNVKVQGKVSGAVVGIGGVAGIARCATFTNCEADVTVNSSNTDCGGFVGKAVATNVFTGCKVKANVTSSAASKNRVGGLIGWNSSVSTTITDCHILEGTTLTDASGRTATGNGNYGGLIGFGDTTGTILTIKNCTVNVVIDACDYATYNALLIGGTGYASTTVVENCAVKGTLKGGNYSSGLFGAVQGDLTISNCSCEGDITAAGQRCGGFLGSVVSPNNYTAPVKITNSYYNGKISCTGQQIGGLVGFTQQPLEITNCYAAGEVASATAGTGGLVGTIDVVGSVISKCIAWNSKIDCQRTDNTKWAPGAVVGAVNKASTLSGCIRKADMNFIDVSGAMVLVDHEDVTEGQPEAPAYSTAATQRAYHGKAAAEGKTASAVAKELGWDETVWDLSGSVPVLK